MTIAANPQPTPLAPIASSVPSAPLIAQLLKQRGEQPSPVLISTGSQPVPRAPLGRTKAPAPLIAQQLPRGKAASEKPSPVKVIAPAIRATGPKPRPVQAGPFNARPSQAQQTQSDPLEDEYNWIYENLKLPNQHIYNLWQGPHDYVVRVVMDQNAVAPQPSSISLKATLADASGKAARIDIGSVAIRHESSAVKASTGTKLQFGYDVMHASGEKRSEYSTAGEPVMDLISIEAKTEGTINRLRSELGFGLGKKPDLEVVMQDALALGGYIRWRRVWEDPRTAVKSGIDLVLGMKGEGSMEAGRGAAPGGFDGKAAIEVTARYFGPLAKTADVHRLEASASQALAQLWTRDQIKQPVIDSHNHGDKAVARRIVTLHLLFGASVWQLASGSVSGGKNQGHLALDLAIRTNHLLQATGMLPASRSIASTAEASQLLRALWSRGSAGQRAIWAKALANPLSVNFGLPEVRAANTALLKERAPSDLFDAHRRLFLQAR